MIEHLKQMRKVAGRLLPYSSHDQEDAVSEAIVSLLENPPKNQDNLKAYYSLRTQSKCYDKIKAKKMKVLGEDSESLAGKELPPVFDLIAHEENTKQGVKNQRALALVETLGDNQRKVVKLRLKGFTNSEISIKLKMKIETVRVSYCRGTKRLREIMNAL